jgi:nucleoside-diphosphate-sugar epimerase
VRFTGMSKLSENVGGMRVLVTGGAGFIGSHMVDHLLEGDAEVWVLDDLSSGSLRNLKLWKGNPKLHFRKGAVTQYKVLESLTKKADAVIHLAALVSPYLSLKEPEAVNAVNVSGTLNVLRAALRNKLQRIVFASSSSVYGNQSTFPISEDNPLQPVTPYGASKLAAEKYCGAYYRTFGLPTISLRYFNVYGERQSANPYSGVIAIFAKRFLQGGRPIIFGDGKQTRDFIHVSDVAQANLQALKSKKGLGEAFNIGTGKATTINQLCSTLAKLYGKTGIEPVHANMRSGDIRDSYASVDRARTVLNFDPTVELDRGLQRLITSLRPQND